MLWMCDKRAEAEEPFRKAVELEGSSPETWITLMQYFADMKQESKAKELFEQARQRIKPEELSLTLAEGNQILGNFAEAQKWYEKALEERPNHIPVLRNAANFRLRQAQTPADFASVSELYRRILQLPSKSKEEWDRRAERLRRQILVSLGLWPMPSKTPLNPVIHGRVERDDYTVEKVFFESAPGFFVTGNLYRPKNKTGPRPGVLCPHGHWTNGRFLDRGEEAVRRDIVEGAERFDEGGRSLLQAR
jgi:tetratricopeptide (TPR) repeat protein